MCHPHPTPRANPGRPPVDQVRGDRAANRVIQVVAGPDASIAGEHKSLHVSSEHVIDTSVGRIYPAEPGSFHNLIAEIMYIKNVVSHATDQKVGACAAVQRVISQATMDGVFTSPAKEAVISCVASYVVIAGAANRILDERRWVILIQKCVGDVTSCGIRVGRRAEIRKLRRIRGGDPPPLK